MAIETTIEQRSIRKCNNLTGKEWLQNSMSIWSNLRKTKAETQFNHPDSFPLALVKKILDCFTNDEDKVILDPFVGIGSTVIQSLKHEKYGIGLDISESYLEIAGTRLKQNDLFETNGSYRLLKANALEADRFLEPDSVDLILTSPPYWDILTRKRTADGKDVRNYGNNNFDLGNIHDYDQFMNALNNVFTKLSSILKKDKYCIINVMDIRKGPNFYPVHADLSKHLCNGAYELDDIIIWDRSHEYNNLRPLGYPSVFRVNRIHEYLLIFKNRRSHNDPILRKP